MTIPTQPFGCSGHMSTRTLFGAASLGSVTQDEADRTLEVLLQYGVGSPSFRVKLSHSLGHLQ